MVSVTGDEGSSGTRAGVSIADMTAGMYAAYGVMLALRMKEKTGEGQEIDVSMLEGQLALLSTMISAYCADGKIPRPTGNTYAALVPYQTFHTKTRDLAIAIAGDKLWKKLCPAIGCPELTDDPRFSRALERNKHRTTLLPMLQKVFMTRPYEEWEPLLLKNDIPVGAINDLSQVVEHPQVKARNALVEVEHPKAGKIRVIRSPVRLSKAPFAVRSPAPMLGQHTQDVLREVLGMSAKEIAALEATGALGAKPG
jgi:crotonobetainyl-CoA:carnitine CoA-transferase CaiB-like acyl-CoA transferase